MIDELIAEAASLKTMMIDATLDLPGECGEPKLMDQAVFYGKREQTDAGVSA